MEQLKIPKTFSLMGHTYKVKILKKLNKEDDCGDIDRQKKLIRLKKPNKDYTWEMMEETFFHELVHAILDETEHPKLSDNEKMVELLGRALHQSIKTFTY